MKPHGKVYDAVYLTDEEKIVVDALRAGAEVLVNFHDVAYADAVRRSNELPTDLFPNHRENVVETDQIPYVVLVDSNERVEIRHYSRLWE